VVGHDGHAGLPLRGEVGQGAGVGGPVLQGGVDFAQALRGLVQQRDLMAARVLLGPQQAHHARDQHAVEAVHVHAQQHGEAQLATRVRATHHGRDHLGQCHGTAQRTDLRADEVARIARAVLALVVLEHGACHLLGVLVVPLQQPGADDGVGVELAPLVTRQLGTRVQQHGVQVQHGNVVHQPGDSGHAGIEAQVGRPADHPHHGPGGSQCVVVLFRVQFACERELEGQRIGQRQLFQDVQPRHPFDRSGHAAIERQARQQVFHAGAQAAAGHTAFGGERLLDGGLQLVRHQAVVQVAVDGGAAFNDLDALGVEDGLAGDDGASRPELDSGLREVLAFYLGVHGRQGGGHMSLHLTIPP